MPEPRSEPEVRVVSAKPADIECDLLVIPVFEDDELTDLEGLDAASGGDVSRARARHEFRPKPNELFVTHLVNSEWHARRVALVGVGATGDDVGGRLRNAAATVAHAAHRLRVERLAFLARGDVASGLACQAITEGMLLGNFVDRRFKTDDEEALPPIKVCEIVSARPITTDIEQAVEAGWALAEATNLARELGNAPGNVLTPRVFADRAAALVAEHGIQVEILDETAINGLGMGLLLGVAQGSVEPPRLIVMRHQPSGAPKSPVLGLVGKGITFDSGGISLKSADGMEQMKGDMAGGAAVVCAMRAIGALGVPVRVIGVVPTTENMPGGRATKPGDVLTSASGRTVEVVNTDAEGRLILGDALWYARQQGATHLVDVATLTGACVVALGKVASGLFGQSQAWLDTVRQSADRAGERAWPLPLYEEYREQLRSETADIRNSGGRPAGACTAATFLKAFVGDAPWAHVDIAGTAWNDDSQSSGPQGSTGVMVRTLAELARTTQSW